MGETICDAPIIPKSALLPTNFDRDTKVLDLQTGNVYENVSSGVGTSCPLFVVNRALSKREFLHLLDITMPHNLIPGEFIAPIREQCSIDEIIEVINERTIVSLAHDILRTERYSLRNERKRPWSMQTRRPFRGITDKVAVTFEDKIKLAEKVVEDIGPPWQNSNRGAPPKYDPKKFGAAILAKGSLSFVDLAAEIRAIKYDMTIKGTKDYPCPSQLHHVFDKKIPKEWLEKALLKYDDLSVEQYSKFEEKLDVFVVDGFAITCETLIKKYVAMTWRLMREYVDYTALVRTTTNTIRGIKDKTNKILEFLPLIPPDSEVTADTEFDVESNYQSATEKKIDLHIKQRKGDARKSWRKKARVKFERKKYGKRKLGERPFGNIKKRKTRSYYVKPENRKKYALLVGCEHNAIQYIRNKAWCDLFIRVEI